MKILKQFIIPTLCLICCLVSIELSIYGLLYIHFNEMAHGDFWQGNLVAWLILSVIATFISGGVIFTGMLEVMEE